MKYLNEYDNHILIIESSQPITVDKGANISENLQYHIDNNITLGECIFRYGSESYIDLVNEVKNLYNKNQITLNKTDQYIIDDLDCNTENDIKLGIIYEDLSEDINEENLYKGKKVKLNKPKRGGSKKFYVYVKNPKTGKIKKVSFGAKAGGGNLAVKLRDPAARKRFADRHQCELKNDKTKPGYWSCRLPRYAKLLGLSGGGKWW